jgi:hypothetical protein
MLSTTACEDTIDEGDVAIIGDTVGCIRVEMTGKNRGDLPAGPGPLVEDWYLAAIQKETDIGLEGFDGNNLIV